MANITNPTLKIVETLPDRSCVVSVSTTLTFSAFDINNMRLGLRYRVNCVAFGDDTLFDASLINFTSQFFTGINVPATQVITFKKTVSANILDEDLGNAPDQIYAKVSLVNTEIPVTVVATRQSNTINHHFEA